MENRRIKLIGWLGVVGFISLFFFHLHVLKILEEGNRLSYKTRNRHIVYQYLINSLQDLESRFYKTRILARPGNAEFYLTNLDRKLHQMRETLKRISEGGTLSVRTPLNLPGSDYITTEVHIPPGMIDRENLTDILGSFTLMCQEGKALKALLLKRFALQKQGGLTPESRAALRHEELVMTKDLDANVRRMIENVNRIYYYDQQKVTAQKKAFERLTQRYRLIEYLGFFFLIALIGLEAYLYTRNLLKTNRQLNEKLYVDALTGLRTRHYLDEKIQPGDQSCLALLDLRNFGRIIGLYGTGFADRVLKQVAVRLQAALEGSGCALIHFNGDIFAIYEQEEQKNKRSIEQRIMRLKNLIENQDFIIDGISVELRVAAGAAQGSSCREEAFIALQQAKNNSKGFQTYYGGDYRKELEKILEWERRIKQAIDRHRVVPFFQPVVDREGQTVSYEALMRIAEGDKENPHYLAPGAFLQIARQTGQYEDLSRLMIRETFARSRHLSKFSINVGAWEIDTPSYWEELETLIEKYEAQGRVTFEILEHESFEDYQEVSRFITRFKELDVLIAIDDFGSGYSSLQRVLDLRPDYLKIDGSIMRKITENSTEKELVTLIVNLARTMGAQTVAEFVEDQEIFELAKALGVDYFQGYHFAAPAPLDQFLDPQPASEESNPA
ncbi:EAL domain-containing protein [Nitratifractor sp.]|uniref:EAL domain-containing protein n=1 Tax=Nitratifractor sp. TaxID=2268144 RepID=UPI0025FB7B1D|nr:GGDEF domain-containing phosphodiesterase [Nitratifractor sp.]